MSSPAPPAAARSLHGDAVLSVGILGAITVMLVPLPTLLLDMLLALNLGATILLLMVTLSARRALDLSVFPSLLLLLTLYRLSLNVATTRLILLDGAAGQLVSAFGHFVVGGNLVVGLVIFLILVVIQFVVITKGAGRISEVAARFTLDALPGKQMAIDAELNAGAIDDVEARRRRKHLATETEFYGAMDGASKFVRGDAIAGLIITAINLIGGIIIGVRNGLSLADSVHSYSVLTIGDGLISQLPALIIATTAGMLTTKASSEDALSDEITRQLLRNKQPLLIAAAMFGVLGLMPGIPHLPFLAIAAGTAGVALRRRPRPAAAAETPAPGTVKPRPAEGDEEGQLRNFLQNDRATVEVGPALVPLLQSTRTKGLIERITTLRRDFSREHGLWIPQIRVAPNQALTANRYRVFIAGREVAAGEIYPDEHLAILPENRPVNLPGLPTTEPVFKLPAKWINPAIARQAEAQGCTVVDAMSVLITHLDELLQRHGHELLSRESLKQMLDSLKGIAPTVLEELKTENIRMATIHQVLMQLAEDRIPLADLTLVLEAMLNHAATKKTVDELCDAVRTDLGQLLCARHLNADGALQMLAFQPQLETRLREALADGQLAIPAPTLNRLLSTLTDRTRATPAQGVPLALVVHHTLRRPLKRLLRRSLPQLACLAFREIPTDLAIHPMGIVRIEDVFDAAAERPALSTPQLAAA
jgi:flagellar biosynthesis protein FlhA